MQNLDDENYDTLVKEVKTYIKKKKNIKKKRIFFFLFAGLGFELRAYTLSHSTRPFFVKGFSEIGSL
jgi:hypothetical protein